MFDFQRRCKPSWQVLQVLILWVPRYITVCIHVLIQIQSNSNTHTRKWARIFFIALLVASSRASPFDAEKNSLSTIAARMMSSGTSVRPTRIAASNVSAVKISKNACAPRGKWDATYVPDTCKHELSAPFWRFFFFCRRFSAPDIFSFFCPPTSTIPPLAIILALWNALTSFFSACGGNSWRH